MCRVITGLQKTISLHSTTPTLPLSIDFLSSLYFVLVVWSATRLALSPFLAAGITFCPSVGKNQSVICTAFSIGPCVKVEKETHTLRYRKTLTGSTVVLTCCKGDSSSQWETPIFGPPQTENPLTDLDRGNIKFRRSGFSKKVTNFMHFSVFSVHICLRLSAFLSCCIVCLASWHGE